MTRSPLRRPVLLALATFLGGLGLLAGASPAHAWWRGGFYVGGPGPYWGPPVYYPPPVIVAPPPPVIYAPPPVTYTPPPPVTYAPPGAYAPGGYAQSAAQSCVAGPYVCPLPQSFPAGSGCTCFDNAGRRIAGQAR